jgi:hypothetical protein
MKLIDLIRDVESIQGYIQVSYKEENTNLFSDLFLVTFIEFRGVYSVTIPLDYF